MTLLRGRNMRVERLEDRTLLTTLTQVAHFDTWDGEVPSTDVAGITYHPGPGPGPGSLYLADSEINETPQFLGDNVFEVSLDGQQLHQAIASGNNEPTGITYSEFDDFFYITNDDNQTIQRYDSNLDDPLVTVFTEVDVPSATDPEGITSDPSTGYLYVIDAHGGGTQVLVYDSNLQFEYSFPVSAELYDPEGIAFDADNNHLFIVSEADNLIAEYALNGAYVEQYDTSGLIPSPGALQGLTFGPTSDTLDDPNNTSLYIADGGVDAVPDGGVFEVAVSGGQLAQNTAPLVNAGGTQELLFESFPMSADLNAGVADDGLPNPPSAMTTLWTQVSGPGTVSFADATAVDPTVTFPGAGTYVLRLTADDGDLITTDDTTIVVKRGLEVRITASTDDAEERISSGAMFLSGADLDLGTDNGGSTLHDQIVGLRFPGVNVPQGAIIDNAYVQFRADETDAIVTSLMIEGEDIDDAPTFSSANGDISSRDRTLASAAWSPAPWTKNEVGIDQQTPDIASIIQAIVNRPGWSSGSAMGIFFSGTGERVAEPFDGNVPEFAPLLHVEFSIPGVTITESGGTTDVTEGGVSDSYTVVLDSVPASNVDVTVTPDVQTDLGAGPGTAIVLAFTPTNALTPQSVNVTAAEDLAVEGLHHGTITHTVNSADPNYDGIPIDHVVANITDNDSFATTDLYLSLHSDATLPGALNFANEDIVAFDGTDFRLFFDGSDAGLAAMNVDAFAVISPDEILLSFRSSETIPGIAGTVEDSDIVKFTATQLGETTSGVFELFFRGLDVGLSPSLEDVDAFDVHNDGRLIVSTIGSFDVTGVSGGDDDLIAFTPDTPGDYSSGTWAMYFDGSDVELAGEDVFGVALDGDGDIHLSTTSAFSVTNVSGDDEDVFTFSPTQLGTDTAGVYASTLLFDGSQYGLAANDVNAIDRPIPPTVETMVVDNGTNQRSMVRSITVTFDQAVIVDAGAFLLTNTTDSTTIVPQFTTSVVNDKTVATLTFSGTGIVGGSLYDGNYTLTIYGSKIRVGTTSMTSDYMDDFFRLLGDGDGDRDVDRVDFALFRDAYGTSAGDPKFNAAFDHDNDGDLDRVDYAVFRNAYGNSLPE